MFSQADHTVTILSLPFSIKLYVDESIYSFGGYITLFGSRGTNIFEMELEGGHLNIVGKSSKKDMHIKSLSWHCNHSFGNAKVLFMTPSPPPPKLIGGGCIIKQGMCWWRFICFSQEHFKFQLIP